MRIRISWTAIDHRFDRSVKGEFIDTYGHRGHAPRVLEGLQRCARLRKPAWMRQVIVINSVHARYREGVAHYLLPDRIYGGLVTGEVYRQEREPKLKDSIQIVELAGAAHELPLAD